jgi:hypothetical protein
MAETHASKALKKIEIHEAECALRYESIKERLDSGSQRFDKLENDLGYLPRHDCFFNSHRWLGNSTMKFDAIKGLIGTLAPTIGKALGGPLGGAAAQTIASVLGCKTDEKSITTAIQAATPEQLAEIKKAEFDFKARMKELDVDVFKLETDDIQNARMAFKGDWTPKFIAVACVLFFGGYIALVTLQDPATTDNGIVNLVLGYLGGIVSSIISFYYGASHKHDE